MSLDGKLLSYRNTPRPLTIISDMVVAAPNATFGLPEALRGIFAAAGGPARVADGLHP